MEENLVTPDSIPQPEKGLKKFTSKIFALPFLPKVIIILIMILTLGLGVYFSVAKDPQVAFLGLFGGGYPTPTPATPPVPVTPPVYPSPSAFPTTCKLGVDSLSMSVSCGMSDFRYASYYCNNGTWGSLGNGSDCYSASLIVYTATQACSINKCSPTPSPKVSPLPSPLPSSFPLPSGCELRSRMCIAVDGQKCPTFVYCPNPTEAWPPTPPPTSDPTPLVQCTPEVYRLPANLSLEGLTATALLPYKVDPYRIDGKPGDRYAININLKNIRGYDLNGGSLGVRAWTVNSLGAKLPISIAMAGSDCTTGYTDKTIRCSTSNLPIKKDFEVKPNMFHVFSVDNVSQAISGTINYNGIYAATPFSCPPTSINIAPVARPVVKSKYQLCRAACYARFPLSIKRRSPCLNSCEAKYR